MLRHGKRRAHSVHCKMHFTQHEQIVPALYVLDTRGRDHDIGAMVTAEPPAGSRSFKNRIDSIAKVRAAVLGGRAAGCSKNFSPASLQFRKHLLEQPVSFLKKYWPDPGKKGQQVYAV